MEWTKEETLYIYAYIFKQPNHSDIEIARNLIQDEWIKNRNEQELIERVSYLRKHKNALFLPK